MCSSYYGKEDYQLVTSLDDWESLDLEGGVGPFPAT